MCGSVILHILRQSIYIRLHAKQIKQGLVVHITIPPPDKLQIITFKINTKFGTPQHFYTVAAVKVLDIDEVRAMASDPDDTFVYNVDDFDGLQSIVRRLVNSTCDQCKGPCKYKKIYKNPKKFGYDTPHTPTPLSQQKFLKISKVINHEYLYIEART